MEVMIESLLASKDLCNLADVLKYPPSMSDPGFGFTDVV